MTDQKWGVYLRQSGEGCDYTIGCAQTLVVLNATTPSTAVEECRRLITEEYTCEREIVSATLVRIEGELPVAEWYDAEKRKDDAASAAESEAAERAKLEELRARYPDA